VVKAISLIKEAGIERVGMVTEEKKPEEKPEPPAAVKTRKKPS
jgi:hypothetical protein